GLGRVRVVRPDVGTGVARLVGAGEQHGHGVPDDPALGADLPLERRGGGGRDGHLKRVAGRERGADEGRLLVEGEREPLLVGEPGEGVDRGVRLRPPALDELDVVGELGVELEGEALAADERLGRSRDVEGRRLHPVLGRAEHAAQRLGLAGAELLEGDEHTAEVLLDVGLERGAPGCRGGQVGPRAGQDGDDVARQGAGAGDLVGGLPVVDPGEQARPRGDHPGDEEDEEDERDGDRPVGGGLPTGQPEEAAHRTSSRYSASSACARTRAASAAETARSPAASTARTARAGGRSTRVPSGSDEACVAAARASVGTRSAEAAAPASTPRTAPRAPTPGSSATRVRACPAAGRPSARSTMSSLRRSRASARTTAATPVSASRVAPTATIQNAWRTEAAESVPASPATSTLAALPATSSAAAATARTSASSATASHTCPGRSGFGRVART